MAPASTGYSHSIENIRFCREASASTETGNWGTNREIFPIDMGRFHFGQRRTIVGEALPDLPSYLAFAQEIIAGLGALQSLLDKRTGG